MRIRIPNPGTWQFHIEMRSFSDQLVASFRYQSVGGDTPAPLNIRLGMQRKRTQTLKRMSVEYAAGGWKQAKELHGIGKYGDDAYRIFILGDWRAVDPKDHALTDYHEHLVKTLGDRNT